MSDNMDPMIEAIQNAIIGYIEDSFSCLNELYVKSKEVINTALAPQESCNEHDDSEEYEEMLCPMCQYGGDLVHSSYLNEDDYKEYNELNGEEEAQEWRDPFYQCRNCNTRIKDPDCE